MFNKMTVAGDTDYLANIQRISDFLNNIKKGVNEYLNNLVDDRFYDEFYNEIHSN